MCVRSDTTVLGCCGFHGDVLTLRKAIDAQKKVGHIYKQT